MQILRMTVDGVQAALRGRLVWCLKTGLPCASVRCLFKDDENRTASATELHRCRAFQVTAIGDRPVIEITRMEGWR
jgi:hypothetical protein